MLEYWMPIDGAVWEGLGGVVLLEEVCHWGWALMLKLTRFLVIALCLVLVSDLNSQLLL